MVRCCAQRTFPWTVRNAITAAHLAGLVEHSRNIVGGVIGVNDVLGIGVKREGGDISGSGRAKNCDHGGHVTVRGQ